jgi:hypothetical protein
MPNVDATSGEPRPDEMTESEAVFGMLDHQTQEFFLRSTRAAMQYFMELVAAPGKVPLH